MKVITQNCFGPYVFNARQRLNTIANKIFELHPDVVFLQEVTFNSYLPIFSLKGYKQFFYPGRIFVKGCLLTLVKEKLPAEKVSFTKFTSQGKIFSMQLADKTAGKGFIDVVLKSGLHLINTHLLTTNYGSEYIPDENQEQQLSELINYHSKYNHVLTGGDFNFPENSSLYQNLTKYLYDLTYSLPPSYAQFGIGSKNIFRLLPIQKRTSQKIDFVFSSEKSKVKKCEYINYPSQYYPSDHKGIIIEF